MQYSTMQYNTSVLQYNAIQYYYNADIITNNSVGKLQLGIFDSAFFAENVIKQIINIYHMPWFTSKAL